MAGQSAQANGTRINGAIYRGRVDNGAITEMTATTAAILAFSLSIAQMSRQSLERTTRHIERLRKSHSKEEVASIQADFVEEFLEHAVQHARTFVQMLATFPPGVEQPVNAAVVATEAARRAAAASVARLSEFARMD